MNKDLEFVRTHVKLAWGSPGALQN